MDNPIIVALDGMDEEQALAMAERLAGHVWGYKVNDLFFEKGLDIVEKLGVIGNVMLDAKLYDIPNTVGNVAKKFARAPVDLLTVHATGGVRMIKAAVEHMGDKVVAVTALTSFDENECHRSYGKSPSQAVDDLVMIARDGGAGHVVCSPLELGLPCFTAAGSFTFTGKKITPGIRPAWYQDAGDDQKRTMTPVEAMRAGADFLVMGRPIIRAEDPKEAAMKTLEEIRGGMEEPAL